MARTLALAAMVCIAAFSQVHAAPAPNVRFTTTEGTWMTVDVSPDGRHILFDLIGHIYEMPIQGGKARPLTQGWEWNRAASYSPDGRQIALVRDATGPDEVWIMNCDGSGLRRVTDHSAEASGSVRGTPSWTPDGRGIVFGTDASPGTYAGSVKLRRVDLASGRSELLERDPPRAKRRSGMLSPDGKTLYVTERRDNTNKGIQSGGPIFLSGIVRVDLTTGERTLLPQPVRDSQDFTPALSRDGRWLSYLSRSPDGRIALRVRGIDGSDRELLTLPKEDDPDRFDDTDARPAYSFTPDGRHIVMGTGGKLHRISVTNGRDEIIPFAATVDRPIEPRAAAKTRLPDGPAEIRDIQWPQLSRNGRTLVFSAVGYLWTQQLPDGKPKRLTAAGADRFELMPALSADGRTVAYLAVDRGPNVNASELMTVPITGGESRRVLASPDRISAPTWSADGKRLAFVREEQGKVIFSWIALGERQAHEIARAERAYPDTWNALISFSSDGKRLRYGWLQGLVDDVSELHEHIIDSGQNRPLLRVKSYSVGMMAAPDGRYALVKGMDDDLWLRSLPQNGGRIETDFSDRELRRITSTGVDYVSWQSDRTFIYGAANKIYRYTIGDGAPTLLHTVELVHPRHEGQGVTAFVNGRIITVNGQSGAGEVFERGTVVIRGRRIEAVGPVERVRVPEEAKVIDATGLTLMPGLIDVHAHPDWGAAMSPFDYTEFPKYGVTTVWLPTRTPWSPGFIPTVESREIGRIPGPRWSIAQLAVTLKSHGTLPPRMLGSYEDALRLVRRRASQGATTMKEYLTQRRDHRRWFAQAARATGMGIAAHTQSLEQALSRAADGYTGFDHVPFAVPVHDDVRQFLARTGAIWTPNFLSTGYGVVMPGGSPEVPQFVREVILPWPEWESALKAYLGAVTSGQRIETSRMSRVAEAAAYLMQGGAKVAVSAHNPPGFMTHMEMWLLQKGGALRGDILRAGTLNGAEKIGLAADLGSLEPGKIADILVLKGNPLDNVLNTMSLRYVVQDGVLTGIDAAKAR